jgi:class 3 adenylate cyclase
MFSDIVGSSETARTLGDQRWRSMLEEHDARIDALVVRHGGRRVKHTGDGLLCVFGLPGGALRCAEEMHGAVDDLGLRIRIGVHAGEIDLVGDDIAGLTVHVAARIVSCAPGGQTWASSTVRDLVAGGDFDLTDRGVRDLRGIGNWALCSLTPADPAPGDLTSCGSSPLPTREPAREPRFPHPVGPVAAPHAAGPRPVDQRYLEEASG